MRMPAQNHLPSETTGRHEVVPFESDFRQFMSRLGDFGKHARKPVSADEPAANASSPAEISRRGWRDVLRRSARAMGAQNMSLAAAGIAFHMVWAFFPALALIVVVAALALGKAQVLGWLSSVQLDLPDNFNTIVTSQLDAIARRSRQLSIVTLVGAFGVSMWSGMRGARAIIVALNLVYREQERRSFWHRQAIAFALLVVGGVFVLGALTLIVGLAGMGFSLSSPSEVGLLAPSRWPVLIIAMMLTLSFAYRYGPSRKVAKWRWVTWGATASAAIWVAGSSLLSLYAARYAHLNPLLGSLGSVVIFLFWCYLTVLTGLFGAQINAELERHTVQDTSAAGAGFWGDVSAGERVAPEKAGERPRVESTSRAG